MNTNEVLALNSLLILFIIRLRFFNIRYFYFTLVSLFLFSLIRIFALLSYDKWLDRQILKNQIEKLVDECLSDIDDVTTLTSTEVSNDVFEKDEKRKNQNKKLIEKSSITFAVLLLLSLICLYVTDNKFYKDFDKLIIGIIIILATEFFFSYSVSSNIENDTIKGVRQEILDKIIEN